MVLISAPPSTTGRQVCPGFFLLSKELKTGSQRYEKEASIQLQKDILSRLTMGHSSANIQGPQLLFLFGVSFCGVQVKEDFFMKWVALVVLWFA